jgi:hypothetical protein
MVILDFISQFFVRNSWVTTRLKRYYETQGHLEVLTYLRLDSELEELVEQTSALQAIFRESLLDRFSQKI